MSNCQFQFSFKFFSSSIICLTVIKRVLQYMGPGETFPIWIMVNIILRLWKHVTVSWHIYHEVMTSPTLILKLTVLVAFWALNDWWRNDELPFPPGKIKAIQMIYNGRLLWNFLCDCGTFTIVGIDVTIMVTYCLEVQTMIIEHCSTH